MRGLGILILIVLFFWVVWPWIARWLKRKAMERAEDYMRSSMGMPPRDKKKYRRSQEQRQGFYQNERNAGARERKNPFGPDRYSDEPIIPKEYAEDVEFTETIDYSEREDHFQNASVNSRQYHESQISDAEYTEIKKSRTK